MAVTVVVAALERLAELWVRGRLGGERGDGVNEELGFGGLQV